MKYTLVCRDSATALEALPEHSVRAIMQDPPAGMDLMGSTGNGYKDSTSPRTLLASSRKSAAFSSRGTGR